MVLESTLVRQPGFSLCRNDVSLPAMNRTPASASCVASFASFRVRGSFGALLSAARSSAARTSGVRESPASAPKSA
jgi:hypothetical protein